MKKLLEMTKPVLFKAWNFTVNVSSWIVQPACAFAFFVLLLAFVFVILAFFVPGFVLVKLFLAFRRFDTEIISVKL